MTHIHIGWKLGGRTGWQVCGTELAKALGRLSQAPGPRGVGGGGGPGGAREEENGTHAPSTGKGPQGESENQTVGTHAGTNRGTLSPVTVHAPEGIDGPYLSPWDVAELQPLLIRKPERGVWLAALGNELTTWTETHRSVEPPEGSVGLVFLEDANLSSQAVERGRRCKALLAGSTWVQAVLANHGLPSTVMIQGVDRALFCPGPKPPIGPRGMGPVIFSGGKLEYRKGQDIVIRAFREFLKGEPDALLLTCWTNGWVQSLATLKEAGLGVPKDTSPPELEKWLTGLGIPARNQWHLPPVPHHALPYYLRLADQAWFPNRCEGGTNLPATECLAMRLPTFLSTGHGHEDLRGTGAILLFGQPGTRPEWVEMDPKELVRAVDGWMWDRIDSGPLPTWDAAARVVAEVCAS